MTTNDIDDFYDENEPAEKIHAAFERGTKGFTAPRRPRDLNQRAASIVSEATADRTPTSKSRTVDLGDASAIHLEISGNYYEPQPRDPHGAALAPSGASAKPLLQESP